MQLGRVPLGIVLAMDSFMRAKISLKFWVVFGMAVFGFSSGAYAYIPPSEFILKTWIKRHDSAKLFKLRTAITVYDDGSPLEKSLSEECYFGPSLRKIWCVLKSPGGVPLAAIERSADQMGIVGQLLFLSELQSTTDALNKIGIPVQSEEDLLSLETEDERVAAEKEFLSRWNGRDAWVIGSENKPQLWFLKDAFIPARLLVNEGPREFLEFQFLDTGGDFPFPKMIRLGKKEGELFLESQVVELSPTSEEALSRFRKVFNESFSQENHGVRESQGSEKGFLEKIDNSRMREVLSLYYRFMR